MKQVRLPDPLKRRHLVSEQQGASALATAQAYLSVGRSIEAIDFLLRAGDESHLAELREGAIDSGDLFLLRAVARAQSRPIAAQEWRRLAESAESAGKLRYSAEARRQADEKSA